MSEPMRAQRIVVTQRMFDAEALRHLREQGFEVLVSEPPAGCSEADWSEDELVERLRGAAGWIVGHAHVTRSLLERLPGLEAISRRGVGYERVDLRAVRELGRVATIAAGGNDASVADHAVGLMLALSHRIVESHASMRVGRRAILTGSDLYRKTVGIVGLGRIGREVARRLGGFDVELLVHTPRPWAEAANLRFTDLDILLARSDFVTLHLPLTPATEGIIDAAALARMKPTAYLINTARGGLVNDADLLDALRRGVVAGAGLDVFMSENDPGCAGVTQQLLELPNVVGTPHAAGSTTEALARTNHLAARNVAAALHRAPIPEACLLADGR